MQQQQNVQRGIIFTFFLYSLVIFVFFVIKMVKNKVDKDAGLDQEEGDKYVENNDDKNKSQPDQVSATKEKMEGSVKKEKKKQPKPSSELGQQEASMNDLVIKVAKQQTNVDENEPLVIKLSLKLRHHVFYHLPFFFPVALNVVTGTSYAFIFVLFFFLQVVFALFNDFKIHRRCTENKVLRIIAENLGYVLSFFAWVNIWGAHTSSMPFYIQKG